MRALLVGDVGGPSGYHVGDEAMLAANVDLLRELGVSPVVASRCPAWTRHHHGTDAVDRADGLRELGRCDALVVSGGGNLAPAWPALVEERVRLLRAAVRAGKPALLVGQQIGPALDGARDDLAGVLTGAALVGVRDRASHALARELGVDEDRLLLQPDDALLLHARAPAGDVRAPFEDAGPPWIALTFHPWADPEAELEPYRRLARALDAVAEATGARLAFVPHVAGGGEEPPLGDTRVGHLLAHEMRHGERLTVLDVLGCREACWITRRAALVVSSRYHPIVFGAASGASAVGLPVDAYTQVKIGAALATAGAGSVELDLSTALASPARLARAVGAAWRTPAGDPPPRAAWEQARRERGARIAAALGL